MCSPPRKRLAVGLGTLLAALPLGACAPDIEPQPWLLPVPEGTPSRVLPAVSESDRADTTLRLTEHVVLGTEGAPPELLLGSQPPRVARAADGRVVVLDPTNHRVLVLDADGRLQITLGRRGQGPGEMGQAVEMFVHEGVIHVEDVVNARWNRWSLDGDLLDSVRIPRFGSQVVPVGPDEVVWRQAERTPTGTETFFRRTRLDGEQVVEYARLPWPERTIDPPLAEIVDSEPDAWWVGTVPPAHAGTPAGDVYVSPFERYQVFAYRPDGTFRWALQRPADPAPIARSEIDHFMELHRRRFPSRGEGVVDWPDHAYALSHVAVDGHGHLWVFPYVSKGTPDDEPRPVDVYDSEGGSLFTGRITGRLFTTASATYNGPMLEIAWQAAAGDDVWGAAEDADGNFEIVRYRLPEPFLDEGS